MSRDPPRRSPARRILLAASVAAAVCAAASSAARSAPAATLCVGAGRGCFSTVQAAVDAAYDGDTIELGPGTFGGGIEIDKSVQLLGVSAAATIIRGGGPVITIGELLGPTQPTVSISRVTITGGLNTSKPDSFLTGGGGVWIPQGAGDTTGATVAISDGVSAGDRVTPVTPLPLCGHLCAFASGG